MARDKTDKTDTTPIATLATSATRPPDEVKPLTREFIRQERRAWGDCGSPLEWARQFIHQMCISSQGADSLPFISNPLSIESLLLHFAARFERFGGGAISDRLGHEIAYWAATDRDVDRMARELVCEAACEGPPLPAALHPFAAKAMRGAQPPKKRGDWEWKLANRNRVGMAVLLVLTSPEGFALTPTRNAAGANLSACDVLTEAASGLSWASITLAGADEIWRNRARLSLEWELCMLMSFQMNRPGGQLPTDVALRALQALGSTPSGRKTRNQPHA